MNHTHTVGHGPIGPGRLVHFDSPLARAFFISFSVKYLVLFLPVCEKLPSVKVFIQSEMELVKSLLPFQ
jgi:hypothetical protein